ncbi:sensor histidine kinase [Caulobacter sp. KR2-114]|uniref:sensor histidine kinase n=1 Tax=Caulobacter sp. KR2-114 TaxID=3400912 RepID=UPI003C0FB25E
MRAPSVRRLLILLTLSIVVPAVALTGFLLWADYQRQERQFEAQLLTNARALSAAVDGRISLGQGVLRGLAADGPGEDSIPAFYARAAAATRDLPGWISLIDEDGHTVMNTRKPLGTPLPDQPPPAALARYLSQPIGVSNLYFGQVSQQYVFSITQTVTIAGHRYAASYVASPRTLDDILAAQRLPAGWAAGVSDREGTIVTRWPDAEALRGRHGSDAFLKAAGDHEEGVVRAQTVRGEPNIAAFHRSNLTGWRTAISVPRSMLLRRAVQPLAALAGTAALLLAAGLVVAAILGRRLARAFALAVSRADALGRGEHPAPARPVVAEDEVLFEAMEQAARRLDERTAENARAREHQRLLLNELNHRVKNTLSTVQSIALQTARQTGAPEAFTHDFEGRLLSLSKTHSALMAEDWQGAALREVLENELNHYGEGRIALAGPEVMLPPRAALALGLVAHELATNASKYGALASPTGGVEVRWSLDEGADPPMLRLSWTERGGPPAQTPTRRGFGSRLIERSLVSELGGQVEASYPPEGFTLVTAFPLRPGPMLTPGG